MVKVLRDGAAAVLDQRFARGGLDMWNLSAERLSAVFRDDHARWAGLITKAHVRTE